MSFWSRIDFLLGINTQINLKGESMPNLGRQISLLNAK